MSASDPGAGPETHYELFAGLRDAGVDWLLGGAAALVLHGVPRLVPEIELAVDPDPANLALLERRLAVWGYGEAGPPATGVGGATVRRFRHPLAALAPLDAVLPTAGEYARLRAGAAAAALVDLEIPSSRRTTCARVSSAPALAADREDAASLRLAAALRAGEECGADDETRREQIRKFSRWSVPARLDWLLAAARLGRGLAPEARPMTRGLVRRGVGPAAAARRDGRRSGVSWWHGNCSGGQENVRPELVEGSLSWFDWLTTSGETELVTSSSTGTP